MRRDDQADLQKNPKLTLLRDHGCSLQWHHVFQPVEKDSEQKIMLHCTLHVNLLQR